MPQHGTMTPDSAPTVQQLLAFYLEAGVDCALTEAPVNRLSDPDIVPLSSETAQPKPVRTIPAAIPATRGEAAPAPEAAILSARDAARTAPSLEVLRALLENFDGCALKSTATRLVFADGNPQALVTLGNPSTQTLLSTREGIMKTRGRWFDYDTGTRMIRALATFHPAYLLRSPSYKRMAWQDLRSIAKALEHSSSG